MPANDQDKQAPVAPGWHTVVLLAVLLAFSALGAYSMRGSRPPAPGRQMLHYLVTIAAQWVLFAFVWFGVRRRGVPLRQVIGGQWPAWTAAFRDLGVALAFMVTAAMIVGALGQILHVAPGEAIRSLVPRTPAQVVVYLLLALTAGICEETVFRGYLQRQFRALTNHTAAAVVAQGIVFGACHGYQGPKRMVLLALYGCLLGTLAHWRRSLRPGMLAHFLQDGLSGLVARRLLG